MHILVGLILGTSSSFTRVYTKFKSLDRNTFCTHLPWQRCDALIIILPKKRYSMVFFCDLFRLSLTIVIALFLSKPKHTHSHNSLTQMCFPFVSELKRSNNKKNVMENFFENIWHILHHFKRSLLDGVAVYLFWCALHHKMEKSTISIQIVCKLWRENVCAGSASSMAGLGCRGLVWLTERLIHKYQQCKCAEYKIFKM